MPPTCSICKHKARPQMDEALLRGESLRHIAKQFRVGPTSLFRHSRSHIAAAVAKAHEAGEVANADSLLAKVKTLELEAQGIGKKAEAAGDLRTALVAVRELARQVELMGRLIGAFPKEKENEHKGPIVQIVFAVRGPSASLNPSPGGRPLTAGIEFKALEAGNSPATPTGGQGW